MNQIQFLALLAIVSMTIPAALAFLFWHERNVAIASLLDLEEAYYWSRSQLADAIEDRDYYCRTASELAGDFYTQFNEEMAVFGPREMWGALDGEVPF